MDLRVPVEALLRAFGLPAVLSPAGGESVTTTAMWLTPDPESTPTSGTFRRAEQRRCLLLPKSVGALVKRGSVITVAEYPGADASDWVVDSTEVDDYDSVRYVVVPAGGGQ